MTDPLPCPFCGGEKVSIEEGTTFRWRVVECAECGSRSGEVRIQTIGTGTRDEWEAKARENAIKEWNTRSETDADRLRAELEAVYALLPANHYMDPPGGGDMTPLEQMRRMAEDAENYRNGL